MSISPVTSSASTVAFVTGAASGIGASVARLLSESGFRVVGFDLARGTADLNVVGDVTDAAAVSDAINLAEEQFGPLDVIVSVAGHYEMLAVDAITDADWQRMVNVHLGGLTNLVRAALPGMLTRGAGRIIAITSELAIGGGDHDVHYAATKGSIIGFVRSVAVEVAARGVLVNAVAPGPCDTPLLAPDSPWRDRTYLDTLPGRRLATPDEVAVAVEYLASEASFCVGEIISVNSGAVI